MTWSKKDARAYRVEVERRFRERTPPSNTDVNSFDPAGRVRRGEMRGWSMNELGKYAPESDQDWIRRQARWYRDMSKRVRLELGESLGGES